MRTTKRAFISSFVALVLLVLSTGAALADSQNYVVQPGDTIFKISVRFGVSMDAIRTANGITGDRIYAGQTLIVPQIDSGQTLIVPSLGEGGAAQ